MKSPMQSIDELLADMSVRRPKTNPLALIRLVRYWTIRTPLTTFQVCSCFREDVRNGWRIGMKKRGYI